MRVERYLLDVECFKPRDHRLYVDEDHLDVTATLCLSGGIGAPRLLLYLHPELHVEYIKLHNKPVDFDTRLFETKYSVCGLLREITIQAPAELEDRRDLKVEVRYRGWVHCSGVTDTSDRFIGVRNHKAFLRGMLSSLWFPCPFFDRRGRQAASHFELRVRSPAYLYHVAFGDRVGEEVFGEERITKWQTYACVTPDHAMLWLDSWQRRTSGHIVVYHLGSEDARDAAEALLAVCPKLRDFFEQHYSDAPSTAPYFIVQLDLQCGGYAAQRTVGLARDGFCGILDAERRDRVLGWVAHEMVHEYVITAIDPEAPGAAAISDGFALCFHMPALIAVLGDTYRRDALKAAWQSYERGLRGESDALGPLPPDKPLADITLDEYFESYKDRFLMSDKERLVLHHLKDLLGEPAFYKGAKMYFREHQTVPATLDSFQRHMEIASGRDLGEFFTRWFKTAEPLPPAWKQIDLR